MMCVQKIETLDLPELAPYRTLQRPHEHRQQGIFVAAGEKVVRRLLASEFPVVSLLITEEWLWKLEPLWSQRLEQIRAYVAEKAVLEGIIGHTMYQGVMAVGRIPPQPTLTGLLAGRPRPWLLVAVDGISNAENLGVLVRNCSGFGVQGLLVGERSSSPFLRRAVRASMGAIFQLPVAEVSNLAGAMRELQQRQISCVAAHPDPAGIPLSQANLVGDCCLIFGNEEEGISAPVLEACTEKVRVPMAPGVNSLNVGSASAVFLYEVSRQRGRS